ncbi:MAG TPA: 2'-5' RNA ligase family protein [Sphingomicrobium sp.]|jgi:2'-5' RNA ligase|nr:2'-5' RNA ligase family protein [Sphingomicrobium sp.]
MAGSIIITAIIAADDFSWLERLRSAHYPPERNQLAPHLTIFHTLPPSAETELRSRLSRIVQQPAPMASIEGLLDLGGGVAFRVVSPDLDKIREELARDLFGLLGAQDRGGWRPHITIQNKVSPKLARTLKQSLENTFRPRALGISGLELNRYLGGPWERLGAYKFRIK